MGDGVCPPGLPCPTPNPAAAATAAERLREGMPSSTRERWLPTSGGGVCPAESAGCSAAIAAARSACAGAQGAGS